MLISLQHAAHFSQVQVDRCCCNSLLPCSTLCACCRDPVDRVISAYEFATEVAARVNNADPPPKHDPKATNTRNVWPWSGLVPWLEEELHVRARHVQARKYSKQDGPLDPYNNSLALPLSEWIEHPLVHELVHDGETLQVRACSASPDGLCCLLATSISPS